MKILRGDRAILPIILMIEALPAIANNVPSGSPANYGVMGGTVAAAAALIAAGGALALCWKGRFNWEPVEEDVPRSAQKFGGLLTAIAIGIIWYRFTQQHTLIPNDLIAVSTYLGIFGLAALLCYSLLIGVLVFEVEVVSGEKQTTPKKIIGGFWLTAAARRALDRPPSTPASTSEPFIPEAPTTVALLLKGAAYNVDLVWPKFSRALAKISFQLAYIALVACGTCALTAISLLVASAS